MVEPLRILLLEDDEDDYLICKQSLHGAYPDGFDLSWASSFDQAMELAIERQFSLYLVDYRLGEKTGIDWLTRLRERSKFSLPPAILLTGAGGHEADLLATQRGFADFISKADLTPSVLERSIRYARHQNQLIAQLATSRANYKQLYDSAFDGILLVDTHDEIINCNASAEVLFGYSQADLIGSSLLLLIPERFHDSHLKGIQSFISAGESHIEGKPIEVPGLHRNGSEIQLEMVISSIANGEDKKYSATLRDITEQKKKAEELEYLANNDPLTGMYNRRYFLQRTEQEMNRIKRFGYQLSIMMLDVDHFKSVNDSYGHAAGDEVLKHIATEITGVLRSIDVAARWGGEEFIVLLPETGVDGGLVTAEKIRERISACTTSYEDEDITSTISIGIACLLDEDDVKSFIDRADQALYHAKENGRNRVSQHGFESSETLGKIGHSP